MEYKQLIVSRIIVSSSNEDEITKLTSFGYRHCGENFYGEVIYEKTMDAFETDKYNIIE